LARVSITDPAKEILRDLSPTDQQLVSRAIDFLNDDTHREANRIDLVLVEKGLKVWGLIVGNVFLAFVESNSDSITVVHLALLSRFRYPGTGR